MRLIDADALLMKCCPRESYLCGDAYIVGESDIKKVPTIYQWIKFNKTNYPDGSSLYYVLNYSIKGSKVYGDKNGFVDLAHQDTEGNWYFTNDTPILRDGEKMVIKYWMPLPELPKTEL